MMLLQTQDQRMEMRLELSQWWKCDLCKNDRKLIEKDFRSNVDKLRFCGDCILQVVGCQLTKRELWMLRSINTRRGGRREAARPTYVQYKTLFEEHPEQAAKLEDVALIVDLYRMGYRQVPEA